MEEKVRVKVIKRYNDIVMKKIQEVGTQFETSRKRAEYLVTQGMVKIVSQTTGEEEKKDGKENVGKK